MSIKLVSLFPGHLNLNGDQANLKVIQMRLKWFGYQSSVVAVNVGDQIPADAHLIFLGHGSMAAWNDIDEKLKSLIPEIKKRISLGSAFMAVSTGHERAIDFGLFPGKVSSRERVSKFEIAQLEGKDVLGYLNSSTDAPVIQKQGLCLGTQLHGPLFAKNPELVDSFLAEIFQSKKMETPRNLEKTGAHAAEDLVNQILAQVWELERELASE